MLKRLGILAAVLLALCLIVAFFIIRGQAPSASAPLALVKESQITGMDVAGPGGSFSLRKTGGVWAMTAPVADLADTDDCAELVKNLSGLSVGSAVAEDPSSYAQYDIEDASATRITLFAGGASSKPVFDAYFGKTSLGFDSLYLRWPGQAPVYLAQGVSRYLVTKGVDDYRDREIFSVPQDSAAAAEVDLGRTDFIVEKSSGGWVFKSPTRLAKAKDQATQASQLIDDLYSLRVADFAPEPEPSASQTGFAHPLLKITISGGGSTSGAGNVLLIGRPVKPTVKHQQPIYNYARISGRAALVLLNIYDVNGLIQRLVPPRPVAKPIIRKVSAMKPSWILKPQPKKAR